MPFGARLAIRLALAWLVAGATAGVAVSLVRAEALPPWTAGPLYRGHVASMLFGWFTQLVLGVAFWMLPKFARHDPRWPRGDERPFVAGVVVMNVALLCTMGAAAVDASQTSRVAFAAVAVSAALCASRLWPRIKAFGV